LQYKAKNMDIRIAWFGVDRLMKETATLRLALYQPDIPQNAGAMFRLAACFGIPVDLIEPCGFLLDDRKMRRAGMDYLAGVELSRHASWEIFSHELTTTNRRLVLLTTKGETELHRFAFAPGDTLMLGRESSGVPDSVSSAAAIRICIPLKPGLRSLNVAQAAAISLWEAVRQLEMTV
jgi:tRNA (cytidine/uridine-2'-O-)-methyltransferase